ncbi:tautomerase family protein [Rhizobium jaguaris]|uniref:Tautomerase family protein n=1 Tax=Rhizobium jaguaris TaxID=1312183 RepID=A0A387FV42_9HYPH|nr:tautomerase family protein [Rhizobium jaguaris]AYG59984.1 tautomerase family protein [Rhizobium jaguaris]
MPLVRFDLIKGRSPDQLAKLLDHAHRALVESFRIPESDRYQVVTEHEPIHVVALDTGLGFQRTKDLVVVQVVSRPRSMMEKTAFYSSLAKALEDKCGVSPSDLIISVVENTDADWSFGKGEAQFLTGSLAGVKNEDAIEGPHFGARQHRG